MKNKLILLCAPSGTGKTTVARTLIATDNRFRHVQVLTTRDIRLSEEGRMEKVYIDLDKLKKMHEDGELVNFNQKDSIYYGIRREAIEDALKAGANPILEWDINSINYWDDKFPSFKVILKPASKNDVLRNLKDGRDPKGIREVGVIKELQLIDSKEITGDITITNFNTSLMDTVHKIRMAFFGSNKLNK